MRKNIISKLLITLILCLSLTLGFAAGCGGKSTVTVTFVTNGGGSVPSQSIVSGATATKPSDPEKDGYAFVGWYSDAGLTAEYDFGSAVNGNTTLYAKWVKGEYTVTFMTGGNVYDTKTVGYGKTVEKPADPEREGYVFDGWTLSNGNEFDFTATIQSDMTLYSKFKKDASGTDNKDDDKDDENPDDGKQEAVEYTVTFMSDNATYSTKKVKKGDKVTRPADPEKSGHTFEGWTLEGNEYNFDSPVESDLILHASFKKIGGDTPDTPVTPDDVYYTVTFNTDGGSAVSAQSVIKDGKAVEPEKPEKAGKVFDGWYDKDFTAEYSFEAPVTGNITLYAKWVNPETVTVTFDSLGGSEVFAQETDYGAKVTEPMAPTRNGFTFGGWHTDRNCTTAYNFSAAVTSDFTLFAKWIEGTGANETYEVQFDSLGGSKVLTQEVTNGAKALEPKAPTREGFTFGGWYTDTACTTAYNFNTAVTSGFTLYAKWTDNSALPAYEWKSEQADFTVSELSGYPNSQNKTPSAITVNSFTYAKGVYFDTQLCSAEQKGDINTQSVADAVTFKLDGTNNGISFVAKSAAGSTDTVFGKLALYKVGENGTDELIYSFGFTNKDLLSVSIGSDQTAFEGLTGYTHVNKQLTEGTYYLGSTEKSVRIGNLTIYEYVEV